MNMSGFIQSAPQILKDIPLIMSITQLIFYVGLALTFGSIIMKAYGGYVSGPVRFAGRITFGLLAVVTGMGISWIIPCFSNVPIYMAIQTAFLNVIPGGFIAAAVLYATIRMMSYNIFNIPGIEKRIQKLERMKKRARDVEKGERAKNRRGIRHPLRLAGLAGFAVFTVTGLAGFHGFPNIMAELGFTQDDFDSMGEQMELINDIYGDRIGEIAGNSEVMRECVGAMSLINDQAAMAAAQPYTNPGARRMVEEYTGEEVTQMYSIQADGGFYIFSVTASRACLSTINAVCICESV